MLRLFQRILRPLGYDLMPYQGDDAEFFEPIRDLPEEEKEIIRKARPFTMTGAERLATLVNAVNHVVANQIPGDMVECGVWRGGSMMAVALTLLAHNDRSRHLYLYDTFEGMSAPGGQDKSADGEPAEKLLARQRRGTGIWCYAGLEEVRANLLSTGYPVDQIHFVQGKIEETLPGTLPPSISLLRLDTDWYESTRHELIHLYPLLHDKGVMIIDDYGHWQGARKAVDEFFQGQDKAAFLHRIDYTGRLLLKSSV